MQFHVIKGGAVRKPTACAIVGIHENATMTDSARQLDRASGGAIARLLRRGDFAGKNAETLLIVASRRGPAERLLLVGLGPRGSFGRKAYRRAIFAATQSLAKSGAANAVSYLAREPVPGLDSYYAARHAVESVNNALYRIPDLKTAKKPPRPKLARFGIVVPDADADAASRGVRDGAGIAAGSAFTKDLANLPANVCTPSYLADAARALAKEHKSVRARVLDAREIKRLGMGSFLSVTRGSDEPPRLIVLEYSGGKKGDAPVALVGKGITFDSGGISLKPGDKMWEMKGDMAGAAAVLFTLRALGRLKPDVKVVGILCCAENLPDANAQRPGDIFTARNGKSVMVDNTDAEGRLVLTDGLFRAGEERATHVLDIATLTGAVVRALGPSVAGIMGTDRELIRRVIHSGENQGEGFWELPLVEEYRESLKTPFADINNIAAGGLAGAITAGLFLREFVPPDVAWAHLDIAGPMFRDKDWKYYEAGAIGFGVKTLTDFCERFRDPVA
jgi:leucyl aminopeptidase